MGKYALPSNQLLQDASKDEADIPFGGVFQGYDELEKSRTDIEFL